MAASAAASSTDVSSGILIASDRRVRDGMSGYSLQ
jgi:hypothetical protein